MQRISDDGDDVPGGAGKNHAATLLGMRWGPAVSPSADQTSFRAAAPSISEQTSFWVVHRQRLCHGIAQASDRMLFSYMPCDLYPIPLPFFFRVLNIGFFRHFSPLFFSAQDLFLSLTNAFLPPLPIRLLCLVVAIRLLC